MKTAERTKHTPGPWTLGAGRTFTTSSGEFYITYGKDRHGNPNFRDFCELDANARLIAAAPEMLEALDALLAALPDRCSDADCNAEGACEECRAVNGARAILARVEEQQGADAQARG